MSRGRHRPWGWADAVAAPSQEFDTLSALDEAAWVEEELRRLEKARGGKALTEDEILKEYKDARVRYRQERETTPADEERIEQLLERVALFGSQASARARRSSTDQVVVSFSCPDRRGIVAAVTVAMAEADGNVESAFMSVVAGQLVMAFLVSGQAARNPEDLDERLRASLRDFGDLTPAVVQMKAGDVEWPRPGSTYWHLSARSGDGEELLPAVTDVIASEGLPLLALSSWFEESSAAEAGQVEVIDLNFAVAASRVRDSEVLRDVVNALSDRVPSAQLNIAPVERPTRRLLQGNVIGVGPGDLVITLLGHARPGFVNAAVNATLETLGPEVNPRGSSMAILEGISVLTLVLSSGPSEPSSEKIEAEIAEKLEDAKHRDPVARMGVLTALWDRDETDSETDPDSSLALAVPTHELRLRVPEQRRVIADLSQVLANSRVNITWFASYVLEPVVGQTWPICALEMHIHIPAGKSNDVGAALRSLAEARGWGSLVIRPWSLTADYGRRNGHW